MSCSPPGGPDHVCAYTCALLVQATAQEEMERAEFLEIEAEKALARSEQLMDRLLELEEGEDGSTE